MNAAGALRRTTGTAKPSPAATAGLAVLGAALAALCVAAAPTQPLVPVLAVGALAALCVAVWQPTLLVMAGVVVIPLEGFFPGLIGPSQALLGLAAVGWLIGWGTRPPLTLPRHPALVAFAVLVVAQAAGLLFAPEPFIVARQVGTWGTLLLVATFIARDAGSTGVRRILVAYAACGGLAGLIAIADPQSLTSATYAGGDVTRATGGLGSPNALGMLLGLTIPVQLVLALRGTAWVRVLGAVTVTLAFVGMGLAVSRGAFIGLGAGLLVLAFWPPFRQAALIVVPVVAVLSMVGANPASSVVDGGRIIERVTDASTNGSGNPRLILWSAAPAMVKDRPIFGMGALEYGYYSSDYGILASQGVVGHAHSLPLTVLIESGILGLMGLLGVFAGLVGSLRRRLRSAAGPDVGLCWAVLAATASFFVAGLLDYGLGAPPVAAAFFVLVACGMALSRPVSPSGR